MASSIQGLQVVQCIRAIANDVEGVDALLAHSERALMQLLIEPQKRLWVMLVQHYSCTTKAIGDEEDEQDSPGDTDDDGREKASKAKRRRGNPSPRDPFAAIVKIKSLMLPDCHATWISKYGCRDSPRFLNDLVPLKLQYKDQDDEVEAILASFQYASHLADRKAKDRVRSYFVMLLYFDLGRLMQPRGSGRIGRIMQQQICDLVDKHMGNRTQLDLMKLGNWSLQGSKLNMFCEAFGVGCLFYIEHLVSENFLKKECTASGKYHDQAFKNLANLGLSRMAEDSGANELGENIRAYMIRPFRKAHLSGTSELAAPLSAPASSAFVQAASPAVASPSAAYLTPTP